jgi:hypothetical protein
VPLSGFSGFHGAWCVLACTIVRLKNEIALEKFKENEAAAAVVVATAAAAAAKKNHMFLFYENFTRKIIQTREVSESINGPSK